MNAWGLAELPPVIDTKEFWRNCLIDQCIGVRGPHQWVMSRKTRNFLRRLFASEWFPPLGWVPAEERLLGHPIVIDDGAPGALLVPAERAA